MEVELIYIEAFSSKGHYINDEWWKSSGLSFQGGNGHINDVVVGERGRRRAGGKERKEDR